MVTKLTSKWPRLIVWLFCLLGSAVESPAQNPVWTGLIEDAKTGEPVPYASVLSLSDKRIGTIANEKGEFRLVLAGRTTGEVKLSISAVGYGDTLVGLRLPPAMNQPVTLRLTPRPVALPELTVRTKRLKNHLLGDSQGLLFQPNGEPLMPEANQAGAGLGNLFSVKKLRGVLDAVSLYVHTRQKLTIVISLYTVEQPTEDYRLHPLGWLMPLTNHSFTVETRKPGWVTVDLSEETIPIPEKNLLVLVNIFEPGGDPSGGDPSGGDPSGGPTTFMTRYQLVEQQRRRGIEMVYRFGDRFATMADRRLAIKVLCRIE